jgi:hypothetical protein
MRPLVARHCMSMQYALLPKAGRMMRRWEHVRQKHGFWNGMASPSWTGARTALAFAGVADLPPSTPCPFVITNIAQDPIHCDNDGLLIHGIVRDNHMKRT